MRARGHGGWQLVRTIGAIAPLLLVAGSSHGAMLDTILRPFTGDPVEVLVSLDDESAGAGRIEVTVTVLGDFDGDLRGIFLNLGDDSVLDDLHVDGADVTGFELGGVVNLGQGANLNGGGSPCPCDIGVQIGRPGLKGGADDISLTSFDIFHDTLDLDLYLFQDQRIGVRVNSVGADREGSSKTVALVPEPGTGTLLLLGLAGLAGAARFQDSA